MQLPTAEDVNATRLSRFDDQITAALEQESRIAGFRDIIAHYVEHHDVPEADVAAALAVVAQGETPLLLSPQDDRPVRFDRDDRGSASDRPRRDDGETGPSAAAAPPAPARPTGSRSASVSGSSRARSSVRSRTRAG